jgi:hypothetical protein
MIVESCQLLSTAHRLLDGHEIKLINVKNSKPKPYWVLPDYRETTLYKPTHINHPSAIWSRTSFDNYNWLVQHLGGLLQEYTARYNKIHKCQNEGLYTALINTPKNIPNIGFTTMPNCMPTEYIISNCSVTNYRNYYKFGKQHLHMWKNQNKPNWL